jgi:preprotein translocase subunit SecG
MGIYVLISVLIIIACFLLGLVVLVQNSKGGGLASNFASSNQFMGVRKTADFLEKATWMLAIALLVLSLASVLIIPRNKQVTNVPQSEVQQRATQEQSQPVDYQAPPQQ